MNIDSLNTSRRATKPSQDKEDRLRRWGERERAGRAAETAEHRQERLTKRRERDRAGRSTLTAATLVLFVVHIYIL